jgi:integrase
LKKLTGQGRYVFPSIRRADSMMSENTVSMALRAMGYSKEQVNPHGFRATARTLLDEVLGYRIELIEMQLAHAVKDVHGRAYNRTTFLAQRKEMIQAWADYLDSLAAGATILPFKTA